MKRREFLAGAAAVGVISTSPESLVQAQAGSASSGHLMLASSPGTLRGEMLYRPLGATGVEISALGLGGAHMAKPGVEEPDSIKLIQEALDRGLNFLDNSWDYNDGQSEMRMGKALSQGGYRQKAFLMTKIDGRTKEVATRQIETSLQRLQTDHIDLLQHHEIIRFDDPDRIFGAGGAMEAVLEAKQAGKIRFIGFTGHKDPHIHLYMLQVAKQHGFHFDTVQMPLNVLDAHFRSFARLVVPEAVQQKVGILGMKPFCGGNGIVLKAASVTPLDCLHYALNLPTSVVITGIDNHKVLDQAFEAAKSFHSMNQEQVASLLSKTAEVAATGKYELFKTSTHFDSTIKHPDWLGSDSPEVQKIAGGAQA